MHLLIAIGLVPRCVRASVLDRIVAIGYRACDVRKVGITDQTPTEAQRVILELVAELVFCTRLYSPN